MMDGLEKSSVAADWQLVRTWSVNWRYEPSTNDPEAARRAERFVNACESVIAWLERNILR